MSLNSAIKHKKEYRKPYRGAKAVDSSCRNHGSCNWCRENREYANRRRATAANNKLEEYSRE